LTFELAKLHRAAIKEDLKERGAEVLAEVAEAGLSIRAARRNFANFKTKKTALRRPDGSVTFSRRAMETVIHDGYSDLFDVHVHLPPCHLPQDGSVVRSFSLPGSDTPSRRWRNVQHQEPGPDPNT
uniref:HTH_48 domain-containing protein n=1 Tax=Heligmosomoides polygyrus TaxID=6339 RepID=A0A183F7V5_HELPZ